MVHPEPALTISELRREIFKAADRALEGESVAFTHKGKTLHVVAEERPSRLARLTRCTLVAPGTDLDKASGELLGEMQREWEADWAEL